MTRYVDIVHAEAVIRWLSPEQGGRDRPPQAAGYAATAVFDGIEGEPGSSSEGQHFSVVVEWEETSPSAGTAKLEFFDAIGARPFLKLGQRVGIMEGARRVADAEIVRAHPPSLD